jgi:hypothetical protein
VINNRAAKKLAFITSWENAKKAEMEAELRKIEVGSHTALLISAISLSLCSTGATADRQSC